MFLQSLFVPSPAFMATSDNPMPLVFEMKLWKGGGLAPSS
jgi:hypothetical protein